MSSLPEHRITNLIGLLYDAAEQASAEAWVPVYSEIAEVVSSGPGALNLFFLDNFEYSTVTGTFEPDFPREYAEYFHSVNPFKNDVAKMSSGERFNRQERLEDSEFRKIEFYEDYYRKYDLFHFEHQVFLAEKGIACAISLTRTESQGNFTSDETQLLRRLMPHMQRVFKLYLNFSDVKRENNILSETLDHIPRCVVVVDQDRSVVYANHRAKNLLELKDGLRTDKNGRLLTSAPDEERQFKLILESFFASVQMPENGRGGALLVSRPSGRRPLQVLMASIPNSQFLVDRVEKLALLFISDPEEQPETVDAILTDIYGLTPAEGRVASILAEGGTIPDICELLGIRRNTVRTHLKHIFAKTDTNRQSELVKLILRGPASIRASKTNL